MVVTDGRETDTPVKETTETTMIKTNIDETVTLCGMVTIEQAASESLANRTGKEIEIANGTVGSDVIRIALNLLRENAARDHVREGGDDNIYHPQSTATPTQSAV
jgi:hypothetical protein